MRCCRDPARQARRDQLGDNAMTKVLPSTAAFALLLAPVAASAETVVLTAALSGANEVGGGAPMAMAPSAPRSTAEPATSATPSTPKRPPRRRWRISTPARQARMVRPVITMGITGKGSDMCIAVEPDKLKPILADPAGFSREHPYADFPAALCAGS